MIKNENIDILLDSFFEVYFLCRFAEQEVFESEYQETEYLLLDNSLTDYLYILDILGFDINIEEIDNTINIIVSLDGKIIKQTPNGVKIKWEMN